VWWTYKEGIYDDIQLGEEMYSDEGEGSLGSSWKGTCSRERIHDIVMLCSGNCLEGSTITLTLQSLLFLQILL
jgi:hypothetical protein